MRVPVRHEWLPRPDRHAEEQGRGASTPQIDAKRSDPRHRRVIDHA